MLIPKRRARRNANRSRSRLSLEPLEPRLLLTTLTAGDWFVYKAADRAAAGDGSLVRVDVINDVTNVGRAEIMRWDADTNDVAHMPGILNYTDVYGGLPGDLGLVIGATPWTNRQNLDALAVNGLGEYYTVNGNTGQGTNIGQLLEINPFSGGIASVIGNLADSADGSGTLFYNAITALDFDSAGTLWGVGSMTDTDAQNPPAAVAGKHLITIDLTTGVATLQATFSDPNATVNTIAFDQFDTLWGVLGQNDLVTINTTNAGITSTVALTDASNNNAALNGMTGIDWVNGDLYGVTGGKLYLINQNNGRCTPIGNVPLTTLTGLAYDPTEPDYIWATDNNTAGDRLVRILLDPPKPASPFSIYLAESDAFTEVRITVVTPYVDQGFTYYDDLKLWNAANPPFIQQVGNTAVMAPANSGGVLIGAIPSPTQAAPNRYAAAYDQYPYVVDFMTGDPINASPLGAFPGGPVMAGITVATPQDISQSVTGLNEPLGTGLDEARSLAVDGGGVFWAVDNYQQVLATIDPGTGEQTSTVALTSPIPGLDVHALDFEVIDIDASGTLDLFGVGTGNDALLHLVKIDTATGVVTDVATIFEEDFLGDPVPLYTIGAMAFEPATGDLYAVDGTNNELVIIDPATGEINWATTKDLVEYGGWQDVPAFAGIDFTTDGILYGVASGNLFYIRHTGAFDAGAVVVMPTEVRTLSALAFDPTLPQYLWGMDSDAGFDVLTRIDLDFLYMHVGTDTGRTGITTVTADGAGVLYAVDATTNTLVTLNDVSGIATTVATLTAGYTVDSMAVDGDGVLWATGTNAASAPTLMQINPLTGAVTEIGTLDTPTITAIAFDSSDILYGFDDNSIWGGDLVTINTVAGPTAGTTTWADSPYDAETYDGFTGVTGIAFAGDLLYLTVDGIVYEVDQWGESIPVQVTGLTGLSGLAFSSTNPYHLWSIDTLPGPADTLVRIQRGGTGQHTGDLGQTIIGGTLAGRTTVPGSMDVLQVGFFFGNLDITGDLRTLYVETAAGRVGNASPDYSSIDVGGTLTDVYVRGGNMYSEIYVGGHLGIPNPNSNQVDWNDHSRQPILELEGRLPQVLRARSGWDVLYYFERYYDQDQLGRWELTYVDFAYPKPTYPGYPPFETVHNDTMAEAQFLASESGDIVLWGYLHPSQAGDAIDYYALPMGAGQAIRIHAYGGNVTDAREGGWFYPELRLIGPGGQFMGTFGHDTIEDIGSTSSGTVQKPLVFTAPEAGTYYIQIQRFAGSGNGPYSVFIDDLAGMTFGGMHVSGNYSPSFGTSAPDGQDLYVSRGNLGAVISGARALSAAVLAERGSIFDFEAQQIGYVSDPDGGAPVLLQASNNIGRVAALNGHLVGDFYAGANTGHTPNTNGHIQNVWASANINVYPVGGTIVHYMSEISASGSIGWIHCGATMSGLLSIVANSDQNGPAARIDLIEVGGDWGALGAGPPSLFHGPGGNVRFVTIGGTIYGGTGVLQPVTIVGSSVVFADDGGGVMTLSAGSRTTTAADGTVTEDPTTMSYYILPVDDAVGGVLTRVTVSGPASFTAHTGGRLEISELVLAGTQGSDTIGLSGSRVDIYNVTGSAIDALANTTPGDIVSGNLAGVNTLTTGGSLGYTGNGTGTVVPGAAARPTASAAAFGWYAGRLNGLQLGGTVELVSAGGSINDLYFTGTATRVVADADGITSASGWDGIRGTVYTATRLEDIDVGDGLRDDGGADVARAAIFSAGTIGTVRIHRKYEQVGTTEWGLLNGAILAPGGIENVIGTNGARCTAVIGSGQLVDFRPWDAGTYAGPIGTVSFSGQGAQIYRAEVYGQRIGSVLTSADSLGIVESYINANSALPNAAAIGRIQGGGPGIIDCLIDANGGWIGPIAGIGPNADLIRNAVYGTDSIVSLTARHIYGNFFSAPRLIESIVTTGNFNTNDVETGGLLRMYARGDVLGNYFTVAGPVYSMIVGGEFRSQLILQGPEVAELRLLQVTGPIGGLIESSGRIGTIISLTSGITADVKTTPEAMNGNVDRISSAGAFTGNLWVAGRLGSLETRGHVGVDPSDPTLAPDFKPRVIHVGEDVGAIYVRSVTWGTPAHLYSDLIVNGNAEYVDIDGGLLGNMLVTGGVGILRVDGNIGQQFLIVDTNGDGIPDATELRGNLEVRGGLRQIVLAPGQSIFGDLTFGGDVAYIVVSNGNIEGNITSLFGSIPYIQVYNGSILGDLVANHSVGSVLVTGRPQGPAVAIGGDIIAQHGSVDQVRVTYGNLSGSVRALGGKVRSVYVINGDVNGLMIQAATYIDYLYVTNGDVNADVNAGTYIRYMLVTGGTVTGNVSAGTRIDYVYLIGTDIAGSTIRSGGPIKYLMADNITDAIVSTPYGIDYASFRGNVTRTQFLLGHDIGDDLTPNTADDDLHSGQGGTFAVTGNWDSSVVALGVGPGLDGDYLTLGDNGVPADGTSSLRVMTVSGAITGASGVVADTSTGITPPLMPVFTIPAGDRGYPLGAPVYGVGAQPFNVGGVPVTIVLSGAGNYSFNEATGQLNLNGTGSLGSLTITRRGILPVPVPIHIGGQDDDGLRVLGIGSGVTVGTIDLDGAATTVYAYDIADGAAIAIHGGVSNFTSYETTPIANLEFDAGKVNFLRWLGPVVSGDITLDSAAAVYVYGADANHTGLGASLTATIGAVTQLYLFGGNLDGDFTSRDTVRSLFVTTQLGIGGAVTGDVRVTHGNLDSFRTYGNPAANHDALPGRGGNVTGDVTVDRGGITSFTIYNGHFRNVGQAQDLNALRSLTGVRTATILGGDFAGVLYTEGEVTYFRTDGGFNGRFLALNGLGTFYVGAMTNAVVASGTYIRYATVLGNMTDSYLFSGFDTSDDGSAAMGDHALDNNRDDAMLDGLTTSAVSTPVDVVRGGDITAAYIYGNMVRSAISAAVGPGADRFVGNADDLVTGTGTLAYAYVRGNVVGTPGQESYGFSAATEVRLVYVAGRPYIEAGNVVRDTRIDPAGPPHIIGFDAFDDSVEFTFDQPIDLSTVRTPWFGVGTNTLELWVSENNIFGDADDFEIQRLVPHTITYNGANNVLGLALNADTFEGLGKGNNFLVILDGTVGPGDELAIRDASGAVLDGEYTYDLPSGDGEEGGDFFFRFHLNDVGDTADGALDLTHSDVLAAGTYRPLILTNEVLWTFNGQIGDNPSLLGINRENDVDVFRLDAVQGDILYVDVDDPFTFNVQVWYHDGFDYVWIDPFDPLNEDMLSLTGQGFYTDIPAQTYWVSVCTNVFGYYDPITFDWIVGVEDLTVEGSTEGEATGSYELYVHLFNDGNSNFTATPLGDNFDATQTPTPIDWVNGVAAPLAVNIESQKVQVITAPDDVDIYDLGVLPDFTPLDITVLTRTIGSTLSPAVAVFNSEGALITSQASPPEIDFGDAGQQPANYIDTPLISTYTPQTMAGSDNYYVAVWGGDWTSPFVGELEYELTVERGAPIVPFHAPQTVYLNFTGGEADYLLSYFGAGTSTYLGPFAAAAFGYNFPGETTRMLDDIVGHMQDTYAAYPNITFTTQRPLIGNYSEVIITADLAPEAALFGVAEKIDPLNADDSDMCVVWAGDLGDYYGIAEGFSFADASLAVANTASHELGHILGLNHQEDETLQPPRLIMGYADAFEVATFGTAELMHGEFIVGYQVDDILLRVIA